MDFKIPLACPVKVDVFQVCMKPRISVLYRLAVHPWKIEILAAESDQYIELVQSFKNLAGYDSVRTVDYLVVPEKANLPMIFLDGCT